MDYLIEKPEGIVLALKVIPNSSKNELTKSDYCLRLKITAPPVDNKANKFVVAYLSKLFKVPKTSIKILRGDTSREKSLLFEVNQEKRDFIKELVATL
mgnify:FL=1